MITRRRRAHGMRAPARERTVVVIVRKGTLVGGGRKEEPLVDVRRGAGSEEKAGHEHHAAVWDEQPRGHERHYVEGGARQQQLHALPRRGTRTFLLVPKQDLGVCAQFAGPNLCEEQIRGQRLAWGLSALIAAYSEPSTGYR
jgi:hypothetical protein